MNPRIYVDTSVVCGCHDDEFLESSRKLIDRFRNGSAVLVHSVLLRRELVRAPRAVREIIEQLPDEAKEMTTLTEEAMHLAEAYIEEGAIESDYRIEARHVALASCARVDVLASWNIGHMATKDLRNPVIGPNQFDQRRYVRIAQAEIEEETKGMSPAEIVEYYQSYPYDAPHEEINAS